MIKYFKQRHTVIQPNDSSCRFIPLTKGLNALVDEDDYEILSKHNWYAVKNGTRGRLYAVRSVKVNGKIVRSSCIQKS